MSGHEERAVVVTAADGDHLDAAWAVGTSIGSQRAVDDVLGGVPSHADVAPTGVADRLFESIPRAAGATTTEWPELWPGLEADITTGVDAFARWLGRPELERPIERALERRILVDCGVPAGHEIGASVAVDVDVRMPISDVVPAGAEQVVVRLRRGDTILGVAVVPVIDGRAAASDIAAAIGDCCAPQLARALARHPLDTRLLARPSAWAHTARGVVHLALDAPAGRGSGTRALAAEAARALARTTLTPRAPERADRAGTQPGGTFEPVDPAQVEYWEGVFSEADPWGYTSAYEQTKYEQTLELLGDRHYGRVLEVACAEGHFTVQLAPLVGSLIATDISPTALERAAQRCAGLDNISYRLLDLRNDALPDQLDLLVCSECLYFLDDPVELASVASRFAEALKPGGRFLHAHARQLIDEPASIGFDWARSFGARRMGEIFAADPNLVLVAEIVTDLYLVQLFERPAAGGPAVEPVIQHRAHGELDERLRRIVVPGASVELRQTARIGEVTNRLPVLMYHRVSADGPPGLARYRVTPEAFEAQLDHLRRHGYYGITLPDWRYAMATGKALPGRAVMITFDDAYRDFLEQAWPLLRAYGFLASVYVVADLAGTESSWDAEHGPPAALMDWNEIRHLHRNGVHIGSHAATHRQLTSVAPQELADQERRARARFATELGVDVVDLAYPYGDHDELVRATARHVGYLSGVTTDAGLATVWGPPMAIPRVEVTGDTDLDGFARLLGVPSRRNPVGRAAKAMLRRLHG